MIDLKRASKKQEFTLQEQFLSRTEGLVTLLHKEGLKTKPFLEGLPYFNPLSFEEKQIAVERVKFYHDLCFNHVKEGQPLRDSKRLTWRALVKLGLSPCSNLLDRIVDDNIVEIYNADQIQIFRNLEFFDFCSYTLEELFCIPWWKLFGREELISKEILRLVDDLFHKKYPEGVVTPLPKHKVVENLSRDKNHIEFYMKFIGPLYQSKRVEAVICIEQALMT